jgi:two-component system chemotaxis response regulator CheY
MSKKVVLVGHCGPDSSYLRLTISKAIPDAKLVAADDDAELKQALDNGVDLILFNRELDYGFSETKGVELIRKLSRFYPKTAMVLVSNYPDAQQAAVQAGALPGFGKRELGSPRVSQLLRDAVTATEVAAT